MLLNSVYPSDAACKVHYKCNFTSSLFLSELMTHTNLKLKKSSIASLTSSTLIMIWTKIDLIKLRLILERCL